MNPHVLLEDGGDPSVARQLEELAEQLCLPLDSAVCLSDDVFPSRCRSEAHHYRELQGVCMAVLDRMERARSVRQEALRRMAPSQCVLWLKIESGLRALIERRDACRNRMIDLLERSCERLFPVLRHLPLHEARQEIQELQKFSLLLELPPEGRSAFRKKLSAAWDGLTEKIKAHQREKEREKFRWIEEGERIRKILDHLSEQLHRGLVTREEVQQRLDQLKKEIPPRGWVRSEWSSLKRIFEKLEQDVQPRKNYE